MLLEAHVWHSVAGRSPSTGILPLQQTCSKHMWRAMKGTVGPLVAGRQAECRQPGWAKQQSAGGTVQQLAKVPGSRLPGAAARASLPIGVVHQCAATAETSHSSSMEEPCHHQPSLPAWGLAGGGCWWPHSAARGISLAAAGAAGLPVPPAGCAGQRVVLQWRGFWGPAHPARLQRRSGAAGAAEQRCV